MGLHITAYNSLIEAKEGETLDNNDSVVTFHLNDDFPGRAGNIGEGVCYESRNSNGFYAGSYGRYNLWREQLARIAGYPASVDLEKGGRSSASTVWENPKPGPFMELIDFSDCEGTIGAEVSAKLAKDFAAFQETADSCGGGFADLYREWRRAFELATGGGAVKFH